MARGRRPSKSPPGSRATRRWSRYKVDSVTGSPMRLRSIFLLAFLATSLPGQLNLRSGISPDDMDPNCKPCADFWRYVNGGWLDRNPIPAHLKAWGSFNVLADANRERSRTILEAAAADRNTQ